LKGVEISGIGNIEKEFVEGVQTSGIFNIVDGKVEGVQVAGIINVNKGPVKGAQFSGISNINGSDAETASFSGIGNITGGNVKGGQFSGIINIAEKVEGIQVAGISNTSKDIQGVQVAGIVNKAKSVKGTQIGLINIADTVDGISIGLFNFVKKGYRRFELYGSEGFHANAAFKIGVQRFYTILAAGAKFEDEFIWGYGLGFGTQFDLSKTWKMSIDATAYHIPDTRNIEVNYLNMNNNLRIGIDKVFARHFSVTFGPSFNVLISEHAGNEGIVKNIAPYNVYQHTGNRYTLTMWPGFFAGIRF
jgi:hypothetical protein